LGYSSLTGFPGRHQPGWSDAYHPSPAEARTDEAASSLIQLEQRLLERYWRLLAAERRLAAGVQRSRQDVGRRVIRQIERERQRLGRELHTEVGQMLAAIRIQVEMVDPELAGTPASVREAMQKISALANDALERVRQISHRIHPPEWQRLRLEEALAQLWERSGMDRRFEGGRNIQELPADPPVEVKSLIFRAAQEGIANIMRHAGARRVDLTLSYSGTALVLGVRDDGVGFDIARTVAAPASLTSGLGLRSLREEAAELNGKLSITTGPLGTTLEISVPWTPGSP
jgi:two-component system, NarL family, sensor kinase